MPRNGSGTYSLPAGNPVVTNTVISSTWANTTLSDIGTGLTNSIAKDGQTTPTANLPMGGFKLTGMGVGNAATDSANISQIQAEAYVYLGGVSGTDTILASTSPATTAYAAGQRYMLVPANTNTGAVTININSLGAKAVTKRGSTALAAGDLAQNVIYTIAYDGTRFQVLTPSDLLPFSGGTVTGDITMSGAMDKWAKGADVASNTALPLITDGNYFDVTGTTTITSFDSVGVGAVVRLHFDDALILTHHSTDLVLPGGANITTAAGDEAEFVEYASGDYRCTSYTKASGKAVVGVTLGTPTASTSGTSIDFNGLPTGIKRITISFSSVSTNGTSNYLVQIGDSGGIEPSGYLGSSFDGSAISNYTTGFGIKIATASAIVHGAITLFLVDSSTNTWSASGVVGRSDAAGWAASGGIKPLSAVLDRVRVTTVNGTDAFDGGLINIQYDQ